MRFSRRIAVIFGILLPLAETVRRWGTWQEFPPALFDDYVSGAFLLYGAWRAGRGAHRGECVLAAAWGSFCGLAWASFFGQLHRLQLGEADPAPIPSGWVAAIKGVGFALGLVALVATLRAIPRGVEHDHPDSSKGAGKL